MSLDEKRKAFKKKGWCFVCLKSGSNSKVCKIYLKCIVRKKEHHSVMCPNINQTKQDKPPELDAKVLLSPMNSSTLLLTVFITNNDRFGIVRRLFDTGVQRSFVR
ncbi:hypothetical protein AVEN_111283-1 [Araneus ventricosus]|uniref:Uncharacterized protein n=1 Tax=Araneus ventricosus TaxID=182803 RepID=A0A4Y2FJP2_ARAVE|nr:hypothetical protein AVEN_111283-1 [Araneus ventricosus]